MATPEALSNSETILLVDDQEADRILIAIKLTDLGYNVLQASDGKTALEIFQKTPNIDLVLTDILMPGMDGVELVQRIRALSPRMKVLFISGCAQNYAQKLEDSSVDICAKTKDFSDLPSKIRSALDGSRLKNWVKNLHKKS
jgi:two-component system, cell cycle sensor histidine kinase and response regulator CckA